MTGMGLADQRKVGFRINTQKRGESEPHKKKRKPYLSTKGEEMEVKGFP